MDSNKSILLMHYPDKLLPKINFIKKLKKNTISKYILDKHFLKRINQLDDKKREKFKYIFDYIIENNNLDEKKIYYLIYFCYAKSLNIDLEKVKIIFLDAYYSDKFLYVEKFFNNPKFIYLARNPYDLFLSLKKFYYNQYLNSNNLNTVVKNVNLYSIELINLSLKFFDKKREHIIIKYEDMRNNTKNFINKLSNYTNVEILYNEKLTFLGIPKVNDSSFYLHDTYVNKKKDDFRYKRSLLKREIDLINLLFARYFNILGYEIFGKIQSKYKLLLCYFLLFKNEFIPHEKLLKKNDNFKFKKRYKNFYVYIFMRYIYYIILNLFFYPKNFFHVSKLILGSKND